MQSVCMGDEAYSPSLCIPDAAAVVAAAVVAAAVVAAAQDTSAASALSQHLVVLPQKQEHVQKHECKPHPV